MCRKIFGLLIFLGATPATLLGTYGVIALIGHPDNGFFSALFIMCAGLFWWFIGITCMFGLDSIAAGLRGFLVFPKNAVQKVFTGTHSGAVPEVKPKPAPEEILAEFKPIPAPKLTLEQANQKLEDAPGDVPTLTAKFNIYYTGDLSKTTIAHALNIAKTVYDIDRYVSLEMFGCMLHILSYSGPEKERKENAAAAIKLFNKVVQFKQDITLEELGRLWGRIADVRQSQEQFDLAKDAIQQARKLDPHDAWNIALEKEINGGIRSRRMDKALTIVSGAAGIGGAASVVLGVKMAEHILREEGLWPE